MPLLFLCQILVFKTFEFEEKHLNMLSGQYYFEKQKPDAPRTFSTFRFI